MNGLKTVLNAINMHIDNGIVCEHGLNSLICLVDDNGKISSHTEILFRMRF